MPGTITLDRSLNLGSFTQNAGTFAAQTHTLTVSANFTVSDGTFDAGSGTLRFSHTGGSMTHTIELAGASAGSLTLHHLIFGGSGSGTKTYSIGVGDTLNVAGNFTMQRTGGTTMLVANGGTIAVQGNVAVGAGGNGGTTVVQLANTAQDQTYTSTEGTLPVLEVANGTRTVSAAAGSTDLATRSLVLSSGTFAAPSGTLTITNDLTQTGGTFEHNGGTVAFNNAGGSVTQNINLNGASAGSLTFHHLVFGGSGSGTKTYSIGAGDTLNVAGNFTMQRSGGTASIVANGGTIAVQGNVAVGAGANGGTTVVQFANSSANQTYTSSGGILPNLEIAVGSRTVSPAGGTTDLSARSLILSSGTFQAPSGSLTLTRDLTQTGGSFDAGSGTLVFHNSGGSATHVIDVNQSLALNSLVLGGSGSGTKTVSIGSGDVLHVAGDFTMQRSGGTATLVANGGTIAVQGNVAVGAGANGGTTVVQFANSSADQTYTSTGGTLPVLEVANGTRTVSAAAGTTDLGVRSLLLTSGTFIAPSGTLSLTHDLNQRAGSFVHNGGTLRFSHTGGSSTHTIAINGATGGLLNVNHVTFADGGSGTKTYNLGTGDGFFVRGDLTVERQSGSTATMKVNGGNFVVVGATTLGAGYQSGSPAPTFHTVAAGAGIVSGAVFNDLGGDGVKQANELGLAGWTVQLYDDLSQLVATTTTGSTGSYQFLDLAPGTYTVQQVLPSGWTPTLAPPSTITVAAGDNTIAQFGNFQNMTLAGTLFDDRNQDGVQQLTEPGLAGRTIELYTVTAGVLSSSPVATTTSDVNGNYGFTNLGPLPAGTSYVIAKAVPNGWTQTAPNLATADTMTLPNGQVGYVVAAQSGVPAVTTSGQTTQISGTGTLKINQRNNNTTATVSFNDGAGHSGSGNVYLSQFNVTWNGAGGPATFHTFCVDLFHTVSTGQTYGVGVRGDLASAFVHGSRIAYVYQRYGTADLTGNDIQAAAVQIAVWTLSLNNHNPTYFARDADGSYSSGNENVFQVHFGSNPNAGAIAALVDRYLKESLGDPAEGSFFQSDTSVPNPGQHMLVPDQQHNVGNRALPANRCPPEGCPPDYSEGPVRYFDGTALVAASDLASFGFGTPWGQTRFWTNHPGYVPGGGNGEGAVISQMPYLIRGGPASDPDAVLVVVVGGTSAMYFDRTSGGYQPRFYLQDTLTAASGEYVLTDTLGNQVRFHDFSASVPADQRGKFQSFTDPAGGVTSATYDANGLLIETQRSETVGSDTITESYLYAYVPSGDNQGLIQSVTLRRRVNAGPWSTIRTMEYAYWNFGDPFGNARDLKSATLKDENGAVIDTTFYRYYTANSATGYKHGLKFVFNPASHARLLAAGINPATASDAAVAPYADLYFEYDAQRRVTKEIVQGTGCSACTGGLGEYTFSYTSSSHPDGFNSWKTKTVEILPDGNQNIAYANAFGQVMLKVFRDLASGQEWIEFFRYDAQGRTILHANPSAISGYDESLADLLGWDGDDYLYLRDDAGLIHTTTYYASTTATETTPGGVAGYVASVTIQRGEGGLPVPQAEYAYFTRAAGGATVHPLASVTVFRHEDGTGAQTTHYAYTWFAGTTRIESLTTTLPLVSAAQNGPGTPDVSTTIFDVDGRAIWQRDGEGFISKFDYDAATGALTRVIVDVDTSLVGDEPSGWVTPAGGGLHLATHYQVDALGRTVKRTDPAGTITFTVYKDADHETRVYAGWDTNTNTPTGPTWVWREDRPGSYFETLTMSAAPAVVDGRPTGTEPISNLQTLSRSYVSIGGQVSHTDAYFNLTGLTYTTSTTLGSESTTGTDGNFYRSRYGYDDRGRLKRVETANGTIYRTVYDGLGRTVSTWVGIDDVPDAGFWSPANPAGMVQTSAYVYDHGGVGDSNLTQLTLMPGSGAEERLTEYFPDWRNRTVAVKHGVQSSESTDVHRPIFYFELDNLGQLIASEQYDGDGVSLVDANGDGVPDQPAATRLRARSESDYDDQGRVFQTRTFSVDPDSGAISTHALTSNFYFDHRGLLIAASAPGGLWSKSQYDGAGRLTTSLLSDGSSGSDWTAAGTVAGDRVLEQVEYQYDANSNIILTTLRQRFHDETATGALVGQASSPAARVYFSAMYYDLADRLVTSVNVGTNGGTAYTRPSTPDVASDTVLRTDVTYNAAGWVEDATDPRGLITRTLYDNLGRTKRTIANFVDGTPSSDDDQTTDYGYDGSSNLLSVTAVLPGSAIQETKYVYAARISTGSAVNSNDLLSAMQYPDPATGSASFSEQEIYTVNALGERTGFTDRNGTVHAYSYDVVGRFRKDAITTLGTGVDGAVRRLEVGYDTAGRFFAFASFDAATDGNIVNMVQREFNGLGQLVAEYQEHNGSVNLGTSPRIEYVYSEMAGGANHSRMTGIIYPDGRVVSYNYDAGLDDAISRLSSLSDNSGTLEAYDYLGLGTVVKRAHPEPGVDLTYIKLVSEAFTDAGDQYTGLDRFGRVIDHRWLSTVSMADIDRFFYEYDRDSNRTSKLNGLNSAFDEFYAYDGLNRLTDFVRGTHTQSWDQDALGNFNTVTTDGTPENRTHNSQNELTGVGANTLTYDANGNLTTDEQGRTLVWDAWNRLVEVKASGGSTLVRYEYDAQGWRITAEAGDEVREFYYSAGWQVLEEQVGGVADVQYVWSPVYIDALVLRDRDTDANGTLDERLYVAQDANYNVSAIFDNSGTVVERYVYDPFGQATVLSPDWDQLASSLFGWQHLHQGLRFESLTGLYHNRAREYSPTLMRFISGDPIWATNLYVGYRNNPPGAVDPSGLSQDIGHHWIPRQVLRDLLNRNMITQEAYETGIGFYSGELHGGHGNDTHYGVTHPQYNRRVQQLVEQYIDRNGGRPLNERQLFEFAQKVRDGINPITNQLDPTLHNYNK